MKRLLLQALVLLLTVLAFGQDVAAQTLTCGGCQLYTGPNWRPPHAPPNCPYTVTIVSNDPGGDPDGACQVYTEETSTCETGEPCNVACIVQINFAGSPPGTTHHINVLYITQFFPFNDERNYYHTGAGNWTSTDNPDYRYDLCGLVGCIITVDDDPNWMWRSQCEFCEFK